MNQSQVTTIVGLLDQYMKFNLNQLSNQILNNIQELAKPSLKTRERTTIEIHNTVIRQCIKNKSKITA